MVASITFAIYVLRQPQDINFKGVFPIYYKSAIAELVSAPFVFGLYDEPFLKAPACRLSVVGLCFVAFLLTSWDLRGSARALGLVLLSVLGWGYLFTFKNAPNVYHVGLMFYVVLAALWIAKKGAIAPHRQVRRWAIMQFPMGIFTFFAMAGLTAIGTLQTITLEIREPFSGAEDAVKYLLRVKEQAVVAEYTYGKAESLLPYMPGRLLWRVEEREFRTCGFARQYPNIVDMESLLAIIQRDIPQPRPWLLFSFELPAPERFGYSLVYRSPKLAWGLGKEAFCIYCPVGDEHPPPEIGQFDSGTLVRGYFFQPFDAKALLKFLSE